MKTKKNLECCCQAGEHLGPWELRLQEHPPLEDPRLWSQRTSDLMSMAVWEFLHEFVRFLLWPPPQQVDTDTRTVKVVAGNEGTASTDEEAHVTTLTHYSDGCPLKRVNCGVPAYKHLTAIATIL